MATSSRGLRGRLEFVCVICLYSNLYTYKASGCKCAIIKLHCATSKSSLWNMGYVARGGVFERPRIYHTNINVFASVSEFIPCIVYYSPLVHFRWLLCL